MVALLALRFLAELGMLVCFGLAGWRLGDSQAASLALAVVLPVVAAVLWGRWVAPRASSRLSDPARLVVEATIFAGALAAVMSSGPTPAVTAFAVAVFVAFLASLPARTQEPPPRVRNRT